MFTFHYQNSRANGSLISGKCTVLIFLRVWSFYSHALYNLSADDSGRFLQNLREVAQNRRRTKWTEHARKKIRPSKRLELYIFQIITPITFTYSLQSRELWPLRFREIPKKDPIYVSWSDLMYSAVPNLTNSRADIWEGDERRTFQSAKSGDSLNNGRNLFTESPHLQHSLHKPSFTECLAVIQWEGASLRSFHAETNYHWWFLTLQSELQKNWFSCRKMHFPAEKNCTFLQKNALSRRKRHFPAEKWAFCGWHVARNRRKLAGGLQGSRVKSASQVSQDDFCFVIPTVTHQTPFQQLLWETVYGGGGKLGCTPKGSHGNTCSKTGSEKVLGRVLGKGSQKGSEEGPAMGFTVTLKTPTSLNKEVRPFFLSDNSIWSFPSVSSLSA